MPAFAISSLYLVIASTASFVGAKFSSAFCFDDEFGWYSGGIMNIINLWGRLIFTGYDQLAQIAIDEHTPPVRAVFVTLELRHQTFMRKADLSLVSIFGYIKDDVRPFPLFLVLSSAICPFH